MQPHYPFVKVKKKKMLPKKFPNIDFDKELENVYSNIVIDPNRISKRILHGTITNKINCIDRLISVLKWV